MYMKERRNSRLWVLLQLFVIAIMVVSCTVPETPTPVVQVDPTKPQEQPTATKVEAVPEKPTATAATMVEEPTAPVAKFQESPMLADMVKAGKLPPVENRLPAEPVVIEPLEEIGQYGGTIRVGTPNPSAYMDAWWVNSLEGMLRIGPAASSWHPNVVKSWKLADDAMNLTMQIVPGIKWSDGEPFTVDDILFWYEDVLLNTDLTKSIAAGWKPGGEVLKVVKIDDYSLRFDFASPYPGIIKFISHFDGTNPTYYPKHYLKDFHAKYADKSSLDQKVKEANLETWTELFLQVTSQSIGIPLKPGLPTLQPFVLKSASSEQFLFERNPYYWKVDTAGNQLPYADQVEVVVVNSREVMTTKTISGEFDLASHTTSLDNYSLYVENEDKGGYKVHLWPGAATSYLQVNMTHKDPEMRKIFQDVRFRRALSVSIDRAEIIETVAFGLSKPEQVTMVPGSNYFKPEYAQSYAQYDPEQANAWLDEMGLDKRDSDGYRLRSDGKRVSFNIELVEIGTYTPYAELMKDYWKKVGIEVTVKTISNELAQQRFPANDADSSMWSAAGLTDQMFLLWPMWYAPIRTGWETVAWSEWARWYSTKGAEGEEPPADIKHLQDLYDELTITVDPVREKQIADELLKAQAENLYSIGISAFPPKPVIVKNRLHNVPSEGLWGWDTVLMYAYHPEQFFIK